MTLAERLLTFAAQAPEMTTRKALGNSLLSLIETLGAKSFACLYLRRDPGGYVIERSISNLSRSWQELYLARGYDATDPIFQSALRGGSFGFWSEQARYSTLDKAGREVMDAAREFKMNDGFTKRVTLDGGSLAVVMASGEELVRSDRARAAFRMSFDVFANEGARLIKMPQDSGAELLQGASLLSRMQLNVLMMRAEGLSNRDIAERMDRREKTVECHVTEILRRLQARNMIDAIRIATRLRLIV